MAFSYRIWAGDRTALWVTVKGHRQGKEREEGKVYPGLSHASRNACINNTAISDSQMRYDNDAYRVYSQCVRCTTLGCSFTFPFVLMREESAYSFQGY